MYYGPVASQFEQADPVAIQTVTHQRNYRYSQVLLGKPWVLRWSQASLPWDEEPIVYDKLQAERLLSTALERTEHLSRLAVLGIQIPAHHSFIGCSPFEPDATVLYDQVTFVEGENISDINAPSVLKRLGAMLTAYLETCSETSDKRYLMDVFSPSQYILGENGSLNLVDIEPLFLSLDDSSAYAEGSLDDTHTFLEHYSKGEHW